MELLTVVFVVLFVVLGAYAGWKRDLVTVALCLAAVAAIMDVL